MAFSLKDQSADGPGAKLADLVAVALAAVAEALTPGPAGGGGALLARPVPGGLELLLEVGVEQGLFAAGWQAGFVFAALPHGPFVGFDEGDLLGFAREQDQVIARLAVLSDDETGVVFAVAEVDQHFGEVDLLALTGWLRFELGNKFGQAGELGLDRFKRDLGHGFFTFASALRPASKDFS